MREALNTTVEVPGMAADATPDTAATMAAVTRYLALANITLDDFAQMLGRSSTTLRHFMGGRYAKVAGSDQRLCRLIHAGINAHPVKALYETENVALLRHWFDRCLAIGSDEGLMCCIYGAPGSQKTYAIKHLADSHNRAQNALDPARSRVFYIYCSQDERPSSLAVKLAIAVGRTSMGGRQRCLQRLRQALRLNRCLFLFDEAQRLSIPCLEFIRELNDEPPYAGVLLLGSHRLREFFNQHAAELEQWHSRVLEAIELPGIKKDAMAAIVRQELAGIADFSTAAGEEALDGLLADCRVRDVYSGKADQHYYSVRKVFKAIREITRETTLVQQKGRIQ